MARIVVDQFFPDPLSSEDETRTIRRIDVALVAHAAAWRRSYLSTDRRRMTSEFEANDEQTVRDVFREAAVWFDSVWEADVSAIEDDTALMQAPMNVLDEDEPTSRG